MDVYVVETDKDEDTGGKTKQPKVRIRGKLKEVYKIEKLL